MKALRRHLFHAIDQVLATPGVSDEKRLEALSLKKMLKGDGSWNTRKVILGWIVDTLRQTLELPPHRKQELARIFADLSSRSRVSRKTWERTLGKLHFMHTAIPGSAGLFWSSAQRPHKVQQQPHSHHSQSSCPYRPLLGSGLQSTLKTYTPGRVGSPGAYTTGSNRRGQGRHGRDLLQR